MRGKAESGGMRGAPGEDYGGVKTQQKGAEQKVQSKQKRRSANRASGLARSCHPAQAPGAGGLTTPKGGAPPAPHLVQGPSELWTSSGVALCWVCCAMSAALCLPVQCPREL